ncbi:MAG: type III glutamate--ammonia ligase, partial [Gammaproteobacteria bacterium]|nr:type III glutamate--ammonia ligase [Gammaproteobacteria bacterium]
MNESGSADIKALQQSLESRGVRYALASYSDMHGVSKSKVVPIGHLDRMMGGSELCTGAALDGVPQDISDEEVSPHPDPESVMVMPWQPDVAWFASDLYCEGKPFEPCNRTIFRKILAQAESMGYRFNFGIEPEFFLLREDGNGGYAPIGP